MRREEFRDALRRAAEITGDRDIVVVGSQSIHGAFAPSMLPSRSTLSSEVDIIALDDPDEDKAWALSVRGEVYGTEIDGVGLTTSTLPKGWMDRLIPYPLDDGKQDTVIGWCLEPHDLAVAKSVAGREKDWAFIRDLAEAGLIDPELVLDRLRQLDGACHVPRQSDVDGAAAFLGSLPPPSQLVHPASRRKPPKGRRRPTHADLGYVEPLAADPEAR